ncbi:cuticle protein 16.5 [Eurosta solidaginis]|uniref:cuticle protein 16.5 n=1 Tax=Eurosta solidaginis TaxID=178769 RepID=UPI0035310C28
MNAFLCAFAAFVAVASGNHAYSGNIGYHSGPVIGGKAYQLQPAVSVLTIAPSGAHGGYYGSYGGSHGGYGAGSSYDINALLAAAGGHISPEQAAKLALALPSPGGPLIDLSGLSYAPHHYAVPSHGKLAYAVAADNKAYKTVEYKAPVAYKAPAVEYKAPVVEYKAPVVEYKAPVSYSAPVYKAPAHVEYKAPAQAYKAPSNSYSAPAKASYPSAAAATSYVAEKSHKSHAAY